MLDAARGCTEGVRGRKDARSSDRFGAWLAAWSLPADARTRIAADVGSGQLDAGTDIRRHQLTGELDRLLKLYRWGDMSEDDYLRERRRVIRSVDALGPSQTAYEADGDALCLAASIGEAWQHAAPERRKAFLAEWFSETRLHEGGRIDVVSREAVREIVFAAAPQVKGGMLGTSWFERVRPIS